MVQKIGFIEAILDIRGATYISKPNDVGKSFNRE